MYLIIAIVTLIIILVTVGVFGYFFGKHVQANKDQKVVYNALTRADYKLDEINFLNKKSADWKIGRSDAYQIMVSLISQAFSDECP